MTTELLDAIRSEHDTFVAMTKAAETEGRDSEAFRSARHDWQQSWHAIPIAGEDPMYERITAADVNAGDRIARSRKQPFVEVTDVQRNKSSVWLTFVDNTRLRPGYSVRYWRERMTTDD